MRPMLWPIMIGLSNQLNQTYVPTNPDRTSSALPSASVGEDENVKQCERNDETYDYIN